jgi:hypothetical protein
MITQAQLDNLEETNYSKRMQMYKVTPVMRHK